MRVEAIELVKALWSWALLNCCSFLEGHEICPHLLVSSNTFFPTPSHDPFTQHIPLIYLHHLFYWLHVAFKHVSTDVGQQLTSKITTVLHSRLVAKKDIILWHLWEFANVPAQLQSARWISLKPVLVFLPREAMLSAVYAVVVCLSVCLTHSGIVSKRLKVGSPKQRRTIAQWL